MVTSETRLPDDPRRSGLLHEAIVVAGFELSSVVASGRPSSCPRSINWLNTVFSAVISVVFPIIACWASARPT